MLCCTSGAQLHVYHTFRVISIIALPRLRNCPNGTIRFYLPYTRSIPYLAYFGCQTGRIAQSQIASLRPPLLQAQVQHAILMNIPYTARTSKTLFSPRRPSPFPITLCIYFAHLHPWAMCPCFASTVVANLHGHPCIMH